MSFSVEFLGCKISHSDAQGVRERLLAGGLEETSETGAVHVVNTCCVTNEAVAKSRKAVRAALRRGAQQVYVTGCATRLGADAFAGTGGRVTVVREHAEDAAERIARELGATGCVGPAPRLERTRAFVKVQDGCTFGCSFCVIPRVRGASRSRPLRAVLDEARRRVAQGHRELVVTGVNLGLYRDAEARAGLPDVLVRAGRTGGHRARAALVDRGQPPQPAPLRGARASARVPAPARPAAVGRRRRAAGHAPPLRPRHVCAPHRARPRAVPGLNLTGDVIVGFPAEDGAAFARTLAAVEELAFSRLHVFPYSPRPGTRTEGADPVPAAVKRRRAERLRALSDRLGHERRAARVGQRDHVLIERVGAGRAPPRLRCGLHRVRVARARRRRGRRPRRGRAGGPGRAGCSGEGGVIDRIDKDVKTAMKSGDAVRRDALRLVLSSLRDAEKEARRPLTDDEAQTILRRELKRRREAAKAYREPGTRIARRPRRARPS